MAERIRRQPCNRKIAGSISVQGPFATAFSKTFEFLMLTMAAIAPPRWPGELPGTTLAKSAQSYAAQRFLLTIRKYYYYYSLYFSKYTHTCIQSDDIII